MMPPVDVVDERDTEIVRLIMYAWRIGGWVKPQAVPGWVCGIGSMGEPVAFQLATK